jgi:hypothetical protein
MTADQPLEDWQRVSVPKPQAGPAPSAGQDAFYRNGKPKPMMLTVTEAEAAAHVGCQEHRRVPGLRKPVCIPRGADPDAVIAEALELVGPVAQ